MTLSTGSRLGAHEIISLIGAGGMGEVYLAQDTRLNRRVAIKILPGAYAADSERIARFHREAQAIAALNHPGIAGIHDFAEASPTDTPGSVVHYLVLELIDGETLADRLRRGALPVEEALELARQIADAVQAAHDRGICHRDLKPANIKITPDGTVKVLDFGLAKFLESTPAAAAGLTHSPTLSLAGTLPGVVLGTAGYMSPEQAKGLEADHRSDVFSFGCVLFEMLTGRQAFHGDSVSEILASVLKTEADFTQLPPRLNPRLVETLKRCLEKNPKKRWQAIGDVRLEIESCLGHGLVVDNVPSQSARSASSWRWVAALIAGAIVGGALAGYSAWRLKPEAARQVTRFSVPLDDQQLTGFNRRILALSPDGEQLVVVSNVRLNLRPMSGLSISPISGTEGNQQVASPAFSPDGSSLVFAAGDRTLKRVRTSGGVPVTVCQTEGQPYGMSWDSSGIVFGVYGKGILRVSADGGTPEVIVAIAADELAANPRMLPSGRAVLYTVKKLNEPWDKAQIVATSLPGGARTVLVNGGTDGLYVPTGHLIYAFGGTLFAIPFDPQRLVVSGGQMPVVEGVRRSFGGGVDGTGTAQFSVSSTGALAYQPGPLAGTSEQTDLALFDRRGGVAPLKLPPGPYASPRVSSDGKWVAFERVDEKDSSIWIYELASGRSPQRLTFNGNSRAPIWSPDGIWIAFQSDREGDLAMFRQRVGSGVPERLTKPDSGVAHTPQSWSPDGGQILFSAQTTNGSGQPRLWVLSTKDQHVTEFGDMTARDATFSPDGRWVAYQTLDPALNQNAVYVEPFPRTGAKFMVPSDGPIGHPYWSAKGDEIIVNRRSTISQIVSFVAVPSVSFGRPAPFARQGRQEGNPNMVRRNADMMPDGEHVLGVMFPGGVRDGSPEDAPRINVVLNWFDELRERVPIKK